MTDITTDLTLNPKANPLLNTEFFYTQTTTKTGSIRAAQGANLVAAINAAPIQKFPFPHIEIENALPFEDYNLLSDGYPTLDRFTHDKVYRENFRYNIFANEIMSGDFSSAAKLFANFHSSVEFYRAVLLKFKDEYIQILGNEIFDNLLNRAKVGLRKKDSFSDYDILLDSTFSINTPNMNGNTTVRGPHVDKLFKLYAGLYYLKKDEDFSSGGDLILYRYKNSSQDSSKGSSKNKNINLSPNDDSSTSGGARLEIHPDNVDVCKKVTYAPNKLILYPNHLDAIHGVTIRSCADVERRLITLVADYKNDILDFVRQ